MINRDKRFFTEEDFEEVKSKLNTKRALELLDKAASKFSYDYPDNNNPEENKQDFENYEILCAFDFVINKLRKKVKDK